MEETLDLKELLQALLRRKAIILILFFVAVIAAGFATSRMTKIYEAQAQILVRNASSSQQLLFQTLAGAGGNQIQNYVQILQSRTLAQRTAERLGYNYAEDSPELNEFRKAISVQPIQGTEAIRITVRDTDPVRAADIANAVVVTFQEMNREINREEVSNARVFIEEQLEMIDKQLQAAELALREFQETQQVFAPAEETRIILNQLYDLEARYAETEIAKQETERRLAEVYARLNEEPETRISAVTIASNPVLREHQMRLNQLEQELAGLRTQLSPQHPQVVAVLAQIEEIQAQMQREVEKVVSSETESTNPFYDQLRQQAISMETELILYDSRLQALKEQIEATEAQLVALPEKQLQLARLELDRRVSEEIYVFLRNRYEEVRITEAMQTADVTIIDPSIPPTEPVSPKPVLNMAIAGFLGLFIGIGAAFVLEFLDTSLKSPDDVESKLGLPVIGRIPTVSNGGR